MGGFFVPDGGAELRPAPGWEGNMEGVELVAVRLALRRQESRVASRSGAR